MTGFDVALDRPWLTFDLGGRMQVLSWALNRPGFVTASRIVWREVRNADLPKHLDVRLWLSDELKRRGEQDSVAFLTSRTIDRFQTAEASVGGAHVFAVATVGLSNAERVGFRQPPRPLSFGTINVAVRIGIPLARTGLIEALSVVVEARTAAIMDAAIDLPSGVATGTGTDCVAVAAPPGKTSYAGLHTDVGEALGSAVYSAVLNGATAWKVEQRTSRVS